MGQENAICKQVGPCKLPSTRNPHVGGPTHATKDSCLYLHLQRLCDGSYPTSCVLRTLWPTYVNNIELDDEFQR